MLKKGIGILLIAGGIIFGVTCTGLLFTEGIFYFFLLFLLAFPLFMAGQWLRIGQTLRKQSLVKFTSIFVQVTLLIPSIFLVFNNYAKLKNETFAREGFLWFQPTSSPTIGLIGTLLLIALVLSIMPKILFGWTHGGKQLTGLILSLFVLTAAFLFITWNDYQAIHEEEGIVVSTWWGKQQTVDWSSVESVEITPYVLKRVANKYSKEPVFAWMFEFKQTNGDRISFKRTDLSTYNLEQSQRVKEQIEKENIPLSVGQMDEATTKWYELELQMENLNPDPFNEFFNK
ncbi:hypothetical protein DVB69_14845 [Sporosarcina sp. BI001-red]|uniref:hypothetical protein n=1 Tax=Sporosarcina sp. BI001-red TaxID=2282866 RepID=UPI000E22E424|nr:hypothetical protein [Sporosarcina sp. BI001-red]REB05548.1 hypothetical protein DVB69_14845 [Sporosarcina sp. BI001-red]